MRPGRPIFMTPRFTSPPRIVSALTVAVALAAGPALVGCAGSDPTGAPNQASGGTVTPSASSAQPSPTGPERPDPDPSRLGVSPTRPRPTGPRASSPKPGGPTTLSGTVRAGVEPGCLLLDDYLLVGGPREVIRAGARVTVTGQVRADLMTTCQQGTPFMVQRATPA